MEDQRAEEIWYENEWRSGRDPIKYGGCPMDVLKPPFIPQYPVSPCGCAFYLDAAQIQAAQQAQNAAMIMELQSCCATPYPYHYYGGKFVRCGKIDF